MGTFDSRIRQLQRQVGGGRLRGRVRINQPYAQDQHETLWYKHIGGGEAKYLSNGLNAEVPGALQSMARDLLITGPRQAMIQFTEDLTTQVYRRAPFEFGALKASGHPSVIDAGSKVYDRPPNQHRLTQEEINARSYIRNLGMGNREGGGGNNAFY